MIFRMFVLGTSLYPPGVRDDSAGAGAGAAGAPLASAFGASAFLVPPAMGRSDMHVSLSYARSQASSISHVMRVPQS